MEDHYVIYKDTVYLPGKLIPLSSSPNLSECYAKFPVVYRQSLQKLLPQALAEPTYIIKKTVISTNSISILIIVRFNAISIYLLP